MVASIPKSLLQGLHGPSIAGNDQDFQGLTSLIPDEGSVFDRSI